MDLLNELKDSQYALSLLGDREKFIKYINSCNMNGEDVYSKLSLKTFGTWDLEAPIINNNENELLLDREWYSEDVFDAQSHPYTQYERKKTIKQRAFEKEQDRWEQNRLANSGIGKRYHEQEEEEEKLHVIVHDEVPDFLANSVIQQLEMVSVVKDSKSDISIAARKGSALVLRKREEQEAIKSTTLNYSGTRMGKILKKPQADEKDQSEKKFIDLMSKASQPQSQFAIQNTMQQQREYLPIFAVRTKLMQVIRENQIAIVVGTTGSGKTTQLAQYLYEDKFAVIGQIGITQPRRVAALSVAKRVSEEMGVELGKQVGYSIRFEDQTSPDTKLKFMTDGILLRECLQNTLSYDCIILDEAHERNLNTDVLMGVLKRYCKSHPNFKLIVTSATLNSSKFSSFFDLAPVYTIPGRTFPVEIFYSKSPVNDYVEATVKQIITIHVTMGSGDILVFLTGQEDITTTCVVLQERLNKMEDILDLDILPIYSQLPSDMQARIFMKSANRKVIIATNIAETSLTVDGVKYVIDSGFSKLKVYNPRLGIDTLQITPVSQANANQRSGRAGRTTNGYCYRLYTELQYEKELLETTVPEIQRTNLANVILLLLSLNIKNIFDFDFMDAPPKDALLNALHQLWLLGAIDNDQQLTQIGTLMSEFPLEPSLSKMVVMGNHLQCLKEVLIIVSMLSVPHVFYRPKERAEESDQMREKFQVPESDHLTLLNIYLEYYRNGARESWCQTHFLHSKPLKKAKEIYEQLLLLVKKNKFTLSSCQLHTDLVRKAICSAYFHHTARMKSLNEYINMRSGVSCFVHPTSSLACMGALPDYIVYHELLFTSKEYMQTITSVDPLWLAEMGSTFFSIRNKQVPPLIFTGPTVEQPKKPSKIEFEPQQEDKIIIRKKRRKF